VRDEVIGMRDTRRTRLVLGLLLAAALTLITLDSTGGSSWPLHGLRQIAGTVFGGAERAGSALASPVIRFFGGRSHSGAGSGQLAALQRQVVRLRAELSREQLSQADDLQLRQLLQLSGKGGYRIVAATVIAVGQGYQQTVTLDAGSRDGVQPLQTVLDGQGLVGEVTAVSAQTCTVLLASDATSVVGVRLAPAGQIGWVTGQGKTRTGSGLLRLQVLDSAAVLRPGEQLVTAASVKDRPYVPGVPVGVISAVRGTAGALTASALVRPYADLAALSVVGIVIVPPRRDPRFSVLPPGPQERPRPVATVTVTATPGAPAMPGATARPGVPASPGSPAVAQGSGG
jgi:rod shape-determining protein MreC